MWQNPRGISPAAIVSFLEGIAFPCSREEILSLSEDNHAPEEVLDLLEELADRQYDSITDITAELVAD